VSTVSTVGTTPQVGPALRQVLGETLADLASRDPRIVVLDGDVGSSTGGATFEAAHPERYLQTGIAEQNMVAMAAGLATVGFVPFVTTFACFAVARALDSIRVLVAQPALPVTIVGGYAGLLTGMTGKTHQIFNDVAIMRSLASMTVVAPVDQVETRQVLQVLAEADGPAYLQITREPSPPIFDGDYRFQIGRAARLREGRDLVLVSTGVQTTRTLEAAELLAACGVDAAVLHCPTIKPIDEDALVEAALATGFVVTVEEQSVLGGLGGAVAEVLADKAPVPVKRLGIRDRYGESGPNDALLDKYRLSPRCVAEDVQRLLASATRRATHRSGPAR
jgi:transketolase